MQPRAMRETWSPVVPSVVYSMLTSLTPGWMLLHLHAVARPQLPRHAGHHHARLEQQARLQPQCTLVVQQLFPPMPHDVLGDEDGDHVARTLAAPGADVVEERPGDFSVGRI